MKENDRIHFKTSPYSKLVIRDKYIISESKIFYLYEDKPLDRGIMDMEELAELKDVECEEE